MNSDSRRWHRRALLLFICALFSGFACVIGLESAVGRGGRVFSDPATYVSLVPFLFTGIAAVVACRIGPGGVGELALLGGLVPACALLLFGQWEHERALEAGAWTGAALAKGLAILLSIPASLVGSAIGFGIGKACLSRNRGADDSHIETAAGPGGRERPHAEPGTAPDRRGM